MIEPWDDEALLQRLADKIVRADDGCWNWTGGNARGRGTVKYRGRMISAPRLSKIIADRRWPSSELFACHSCDNPACMNSAHIWWGTNAQNLQDASAKRRLHHQQGDTCKRGHPKQPGRCLTCQRERKTAWQRERRMAARAEGIAR